MFDTNLKHFKVAGAQIPVTRDIEGNTRRLLEAIDWAGQRGADILLTPEGSLSGYTSDFAQDQVDHSLRHLLAQAKAYRLGLALGTCYWENPSDCFNQLRFYDKEGTYLGFHSKILRCSDHAFGSSGEIKEYSCEHLRVFSFHGIPIAGLVCNDLWANPLYTPGPDTHLSQQLAVMGARIIFHAVNTGGGTHGWDDVYWSFHNSNLRMRSRAGKIWMATVDTFDEPESAAHSPGGILDSEGLWVCQHPRNQPGCFVYDIQISALKPEPAAFHPRPPLIAP